MSDKVYRKSNTRNHFWVHHKLADKYRHFFPLLLLSLSRNWALMCTPIIFSIYQYFKRTNSASVAAFSLSFTVFALYFNWNYCIYWMITWWLEWQIKQSLNKQLFVFHIYAQNYLIIESSNNWISNLRLKRTNKRLIYTFYSWSIYYTLMNHIFFSFIRILRMFREKKESFIWNFFCEKSQNNCRFM